MFDIGCDQQLNEIAVSDRGASGGLTQFHQTAVFAHVNPPNTNRMQNWLGNSSACAIIFQDRLQLVDSKAERCPSG
jgi:hypothetical protein